MTEEYVDVGRVRLWTIRHGTGLPIILCSGGPGCCDYLEPVAAMIDDLAQVYRWEQRGCGRSDKSRSYDQATCIADLEALRRHFGHERWIVGGHSWGANLSLAYACEHLEHVLGLIYLSGTGITEDWLPEYRRSREQRQEQLPDFSYPHNHEVNTEGNRSRTEYLQSPGLPDRVRALRVPVLMIQGEYDLRPNWPAQELAALLPQAQLEIIPQAEHCLWLTHPNPLRSSLRAFVQQLNTSSLEAIPHYLRLSDRIGTAGQPSTEQFAAIQKAGYDVVVNLRPPADTLPDECALVEGNGMAYVSIPVIWNAPTIENVERLFAVMQANEDRRVFVHCAMNMRVSAFMYLYRIVKQNVAPEVAVQDLHRIWEPNPTWQHLIEQVLEQNDIPVE